MKKKIFKISKNVWNIITKGNKNNIRIREHTLTDVTSIDFLEEFSKDFEIKYTGRKEMINGGDWELWVQCSKNFLISCRIQDKAPTFTTSTVEFQNIKKEQIENLIAGANKEKIMAFYRFFIGDITFTSIKKPCSIGHCKIFDKVSFGCSLLSAEEFLNIYNLKSKQSTERNVKIKEIEDKIMPLQCLFCRNLSGSKKRKRIDVLFDNLAKNSANHDVEYVSIEEAPWYIKQMLKTNSVITNYDLTEDFHAANLNYVLLLKEKQK